MKQMSVTPAAANAASVQSSKRRPWTSAKHLGVSAVVGINRRPRPAPMMIAFIAGIAAPVKTRPPLLERAFVRCALLAVQSRPRSIVERQSSVEPLRIGVLEIGDRRAAARSGDVAAQLSPDAGA